MYDKGGLACPNISCSHGYSLAEISAGGQKLPRGVHRKSKWTVISLDGYYTQPFLEDNVYLHVRIILVVFAHFGFRKSKFRES